MYDFLQKDETFAEMFREILDVFVQTFPNVLFQKERKPKNSPFFNAIHPKSPLSISEQEEMKHHLKSFLIFSSII